jgi:prepilin-type N-terminal cleavage/methylation domain-containing protein
MKTKAPRPGFTLIELIIVMLLLSLMALLAFTQMARSAKEPPALSPLTLKSTLIDYQHEHGGRIELVCLDQCQSCYVLHGNTSTAFEKEIGWGELKAYVVTNDESTEQIEFGRYHDQPICLHYTLYQNGSSSQMIIEDGFRIYYLPTFFGEPQEVASLDEAASLWQQYDRVLSNPGELF